MSYMTTDYTTTEEAALVQLWTLYKNQVRCWTAGCEQLHAAQLAFVQGFDSTVSHIIKVRELVYVAYVQQDGNPNEPMQEIITYVNSYIDQMREGE